METLAFNKYMEGRHSYLQKHLTLAKNNDMNICRNCEMKFYIKGNRADTCGGTQPHILMYDFTQSEDVTECEIK
jgi:hypothetical protein